MKEKISVFWSRRDFRLRDNAALSAAISYAQQEQIPLLPVFVVEDYMCADNPLFQFGHPQRQFLCKALPAFWALFPSFYVATGKGADTFITLAQTFDLHIFVNEDIYSDFYLQIQKLRNNNIVVTVTSDQLTIPRETRTQTGNLYSVFTPFKNAVWNSFVQTEETAIASIQTAQFLPAERIATFPNSIKPTQTILQSLFSHKRTLAVGTHTLDIDVLYSFKTDISTWYTTETEALATFAQYCNSNLSHYKTQRDLLGEKGTSQMSLALTWGLVSARTLLSEIQKIAKVDLEVLGTGSKSESITTFVSELIWREFYKYLLFHKPKLMYTEFQERFRGTISWADDTEAYKRFIAWIKGETGYPIVDAAMLQLAHTGWMHNRARMVVASVLTKNLGVNWLWGQEYFRAMLIDLDEASNNGGWQWGASVGADPKPIRIFNPYLQAEKFDIDGAYQKKWLGEERYQNPLEPLVPHTQARADALKRYGLSR